MLLKLTPGRRRGWKTLPILIGEVVCRQSVSSFPGQVSENWTGAALDFCRGLDSWPKIGRKLFRWNPELRKSCKSISPIWEIRRRDVRILRIWATFEGKSVSVRRGRRTAKCRPKNRIPGSILTQDASGVCMRGEQFLRSKEIFMNMFTCTRENESPLTQLLFHHQNYRVCHGIKLTKQVAYFWFGFDHF